MSVPHMTDLDGKTAVVTGSSSGIGRAIAERFADDGANVVINSRSADRARAVADEIESDSGTAVGVEADISDREAVQGLVDEAVDAFGSLDVMVNNAGNTVIKPTEEITVEDWQHVIDVTLTGTFYGAQAAGTRMIEQGTGGHIVNVSSMLGEQGLQFRAPYTAAKGGVTNLTRTLAVEWADHGVYVNALAPGFIETDLSADALDDAGFDDEEVRRRTPLGRFGTVEEMANCAAFLAGGHHFLTGEILRPDGGWKPSAWGRRDD